MKIRLLFVFLLISALVACMACYIAGFRSGVRQSPLKSEHEVRILYAVNMYRAAEATNLIKLHSFLDMEIFGLVREYERRYGAPNGTNKFAIEFANAKAVAGSLEKRLVPVSSVVRVHGTNVPMNIQK